MTKVSKKILSSEGQTTIEYMLVFAVVFFVAIMVWNKFGTFMSESFGDLNDKLSGNLSTGICPKECFFYGYSNAKK